MSPRSPPSEGQARQAKDAARVWLRMPHVLDALVLDAREPGRLRRVGSLPDWLEQLGGSLDESLERAFPVLAEFAEEAREKLWKPGIEGRLQSGFWTEQAPSGEEFHLRALALCSGPLQAAVVYRDEAAYRDRQQVLQRGRELALALERLHREFDRKDVLVHALVHDLGGPLSSILGSLALLEEASLGEPERALLRAARRSAERQNALIDQLAGAFSAERDSMEHFHRDADAAPDAARVAAQTIEMLAPVAAPREVELRVVHEGAGGFKVVGEESRLGRVLANLVENALRHSPRGARVTLRLAGSGDHVRAAVEDRGPGVPAHLVEHLFERLLPGGSGRAGLGLYFCRMTVQRWGGEIGYSPRPGGGASFWLKLPRPLAARAAQGLGPAEAGDPTR